MDPQDSASASPWTWGFRPGDRVRIVDGTFARMTGEVLAHEQARERHRQAGKENQVTEIHRVAGEAIRPRSDEASRRHLDARTAAAMRGAETPDEAILEIAPGEERQSQRLDRQRSAAPREFERRHGERHEHEAAHRRPPEEAE